MNPYEIHNDQIGVQAKFLFTGNKAAKSDHASLSLVSYDSFNYKVQNGVIVKLRGQGPNTPTLVKWESLPYSWQELLIKTFGEPKKVVIASLFEKEFVRDTEALEFYLKYSPSPGKYLTSEEVELYTLNASVLNLVEVMFQKRTDYRAARRGSTNRTEIRKSIANDTARFKAIQPHTLPEYHDNLFKDLREYKKQGYAYLISGKKGNNNARKVTDEVEKLLNDMFAGQDHKPTYDDIDRQYNGFKLGYIKVINESTGEEYNPKEYPNLSRTTVQNYLSKWRNEIGNEAVRSGDRQKYMGKFKPYHSLHRPTYAGSIMSIDDRQPPFEYEPGKRMWFYLGADIASGAIVTWVWGKDKKEIIINFYRQMVRLHHHFGVNLPHELEAESSLNSSFKDTFLAPGAMFQEVRIEANNARGKWIESGVNRKIRYEQEKDSTGWISRPFARSEANQQGGHHVPIIPYDKLVHARLKDIEDWNNAPHHKNPEMSRFEYWLENQHPELKPTNYRAILPHLGYSTKTSCNTGIIKLQRSEFLLGLEGVVALGDTLISLLDIVEGEQVTIYWLDTIPNEDGDCEVFKALVYVNDNFVCEAIPKPMYNRAKIEQTGDDSKHREIMSKYVATTDAYGLKRKKAIDKVTVIDSRPVKKTFTMPGLKTYQPSFDQPAETLPELPSDEMELIEVETPSKRALKDRF